MASFHFDLLVLQLHYWEWVIGVVLELKKSPEQAKTPQCSHPEFDSREMTDRSPRATGRFKADSNFQGGDQSLSICDLSLLGRVRFPVAFNLRRVAFKQSLGATGHLHPVAGRFQSVKILKGKVLKFEKCWHLDPPPVRLKNICRIPGTQHP
ncbi:hypothetical protein L3X38_041335 [Prunus dulcis]|uniref:Uncharacterized protein n=1 Tax=Prunus dulcis TaxID=3755 RepID=A0AAD4UUH0_PRUDU|nr:hypothetical protein L3X38_041335 [Prunus dulcis]